MLTKLNEAIRTPYLRIFSPLLYQLSYPANLLMCNALHQNQRAFLLALLSCFCRVTRNATSCNDQTKAKSSSRVRQTITGRFISASAKTQLAVGELTQIKSDQREGGGAGGRGRLTHITPYRADRSIQPNAGETWRALEIRLHLGGKVGSSLPGLLESSVEEGAGLAARRRG